MSAVISDCGRYRYRLERRLSDWRAARCAAVIMVNPSTADAETDDATIRKVCGFTIRYGFCRVIVGNLFAWRATDIKALRTASDPVGPDNDYHLSMIMHEADKVIVAWGASGKLPRDLRNRWHAIAGLAEAAGKPLHCLGVAADGHPLHPLMLGYDRELEPWVPSTSLVIQARAKQEVPA